MIRSLMERNLGIQFPKLKNGRPRATISQPTIDAVKSYKVSFNVGYQRTAFALQKRGIECSERTIRTIFELEGLFLYEQPYKEKEPRIRYVAKLAGQVWHTDLHYWDLVPSPSDPQTVIRTYVIAFIDDRSRKIMHAGILNDKTSLAATSELALAIQLNPPPCRIIIDNGTEFVGHPFQSFLKSHGINQWRTQPYTPEQNGKIERWWKTLDDSIVDHQKLQELVNEYNNFWPHKALKELLGKSITPQEAYDEMEKWLPGLPDEIEYNSDDLN